MQYIRIREITCCLGFLAALLALPAAQAMVAPSVRVEFRLEILTHDTQSGTETFSTPLLGTLLLEFDPTWTHTSGPGDAAQIIEVFMAGNNRFTSSITPLMPWAPPTGMPNVDPRNLANLTNAGRDQFSYMFFDDQYRAEDATFDYLYRISLDSNHPGNSNPHIADILNYRTPELLDYLVDLKTNDEPFLFSEWAFIQNMNTHQFAAWDAYGGRAYITSITGDGVVAPVPVPPALLLMLSALLPLGVRRVRATKG